LVSVEIQDMCIGYFGMKPGCFQKRISGEVKLVVNTSASLAEIMDMAAKE